MKMKNKNTLINVIQTTIGRKNLEYRNMDAYKILR